MSRQRAARVIKFIAQGRPATHRCPAGVPYFCLFILEDQGAIVREVTPKTGALANH